MRELSLEDIEFVKSTVSGGNSNENGSTQGSSEYGNPGGNSE